MLDQIRVSECRGRTVWDIAVEDVRVGDVLCAWLSDASAYVTITGWTDRTIDLTRYDLGISVQRTFTVEGAPWWLDAGQRTATLGRRTFILPRS